MTRVVEPSAAEIAPTDAEVLRSQGVPDAAEVDPQVEALLGSAKARLLELARPVAMLAEIGRGGFARVYRGRGLNGAWTPLEQIYPRAERLDLFAATLGQPLSDEIGRLFAGRDLAAAVMLDSTASCAAERLVERLEEQLAGETERSVLSYSPGYCGWHVSGQEALFAALKPEQIGITLNNSFLMQPLKSVSGVMVAGHSDVHQFDDDFACCAECATRECRVRIARVREV